MTHATATIVDAPAPSQALDDLRAAFDAAFQVPRAPSASDAVDLLAVRLGDRPFCVRVHDLQSVAALPPIVALPAADPHLLGVGSHRGRLVAVFSLAALLDVPSGPQRWLLIPRRDPSIGLACTALDGYWRLPAQTLRAGQAGPVNATVTDAAGTRGVLDLDALLLALHGRNRSLDAPLPPPAAEV